MSGKAGPGAVMLRRRRVSFAVLVAALALVPVAIAWACNPQAHISLNQSSYSPGQSMTVYGSYFPGGATITISGPTGSTTATTSAGGAFSATLTAPTSPGGYTVTASRPTGGFAPASFTVAAPVQEPEPSTPSQPAQTQAPAQGQSPAGPGTRQTVDTPSVVRSERAPSQESRQPASQRGDREPSTSSTQPTTTTTTSGAQPVFTGSTAPVAAGTFASTAATTVAGRERSERSSAQQGRDGASPAAPSTQTAFSDVWSGYQPGRTPTLTAASAGAPEGGTGSQLAWGVALLALGLFSLVGGLAYTEARRRRTA